MFTNKQVKNVIAMFYNQKEKNILQKNIDAFNAVDTKPDMIGLILKLINEVHRAPSFSTFDRIMQALKYGHPQLTKKSKNLINSINVHELFHKAP